MASDRRDADPAVRRRAPPSPALLRARATPSCFEPIDPDSLRVDPRSGRERRLRGREDRRSPHEPGLKVLAPGLHTTVQDLGRIGYQNIGVPVSGALDGFGLRLANALVGNPQGMAALEILISGPTFEVAADTVRVALVGAGASLAFARREPAGRCRRAKHHAVARRDVSGRGRPPSACCYLAVDGRHRGAAGARQRLDLCARRHRRARRARVASGRHRAAGDARRSRAAANCACRRRPRGPGRSADPRDPRPAAGAFHGGGGRRVARRRVPRLKRRRPHGNAPGRSRCCGTAAAGTSFPMRSRPAPSRCPARDSRSFCSPITRRRADIPK